MIKIVCDKCGYTLTTNNIEKIENGYLYHDNHIKIKFTLISESDHLLCETCQLKWLDFKENAMPRVAKEFIGGDKDGYHTGMEIGKTLNPRIKQGKWIIVDDTEKFIAKCSVCGRIEDSRMVGEYPFCHCGAEMKGSEEE